MRKNDLQQHVITTTMALTCISHQNDTVLPDYLQPVMYCR